jgi:uncharacterized membrane protein
LGAAAAARFYPFPQSKRVAKRRQQPTRTLPPWQAKAWEWRWPIAVGAVLVLAAALRFYRLGAASVWLDEAYSIDWASRDYAFMLDIARTRDFHPPEYYMLLHNWMLVFGRSEAAVRALSAVAGVAAVGGLYLLGRDLFSRRAGLAAAVLLSVSDFALYYSQEARSYSLLLALAIFSMHAYWRLYERRTRGALVYYILVTAALAYVHNSGLFVIVAQGLHRLVAFAAAPRQGWLAAQKDDLVRWGVAFGGVGLLYLPWLGGLLGQFSRLNDGYWMPKPAFDTGTVGADFTVVGTFAHFTGVALAAWLLWILLANGVARTRAGGLNRERNPDDTDRRAYPAAKVLLLVAWLLCSVFIPFIEANVAQPAFISRALIPALAPFLLLAAAGVGRLKAVPLQVAVVAVLVALATPALATYYKAPGKEPWREATAYVESNTHGNGTVVINGWNVFLAYDYYSRHTVPVTRIGGTSDPELADAANATRGREHAWLMLSHPGGDSGKLLQAMDAAFRSTAPGAAQPQCQMFAAQGAGLANNPIFVFHWGPAVPTAPERACPTN